MVISPWVCLGVDNTLQIQGVVASCDTHVYIINNNLNAELKKGTLAFCNPTFSPFHCLYAFSFVCYTCKIQLHFRS